MIDDLDASRKQFERLPVDRSDRLERRERDTRESSEQRAIRQRRMFERQGGNEKRPIAIFVDNADREPPAGERDTEAIENIHVDERRDMHLLDDRLSDRGIRALDLKHIGMAFAEGVRHFPDDRRHATRAIMAEVDAERIEHEAEHPGRGQQYDAAIRRQPLLPEQIANFSREKAGGAVGVIAFVEGIEIESVDGQETRGRLQSVEIERDPERAIGKPPDMRAQPAMHHRSEPEAGRDHGAPASAALCAGK